MPQHVSGDVISNDQFPLAANGSMPSRFYVQVIFIATPSSAEYFNQEVGNRHIANTRLRFRPFYDRLI